MASVIDKAKSEGVDCTMELYPYPSGCTFALSMLPSHVHDGGPEAALNRIKDASERKKLAEGLESDDGLVGVVVTYSPQTPEAEGMSVMELAEAGGVSPGELVCDLLIKNDLRVAYRGAPPDSVKVWRQVSRDTMDLLSRRSVDLVIVMMRISDMDLITFGTQIKEKYKNKPIILLAFDESEIKQLPEDRDKFMDNILNGFNDIFRADSGDIRQGFHDSLLHQ